jgi:transcriptional regulator with XRE-family HTH domain
MNPAMTPISDSEADFFKALGRRIAQARKDASMTQQQLADALGLSQTVLASYETARRRIPASLLPPLAKTLRLSLEALLDEKISAPSKPGPVPKLQKRIDQLSRLPRSRQKFVSQFLETVLQQQG